MIDDDIVLAAFAARMREIARELPDRSGFDEVFNLRPPSSRVRSYDPRSLAITYKGIEMRGLVGGVFLASNEHIGA